MRIAVDARLEQVNVRLDLGIGVQAAAGIIQVNVFLFVQAAVFLGAQRVQRLDVERRVVPLKFGQCVFKTI